MTKTFLCAETLCTGCEACRAICPASSIAMQEDSEGFYRPAIEFETCSGCKRCEVVCPVMRRPELQRSSAPEVFACWHKDNAVRAQSSSGGAFSALAEMVLETGGVVFGACYDADLRVRHVCVDKLTDLDRLRRSKYVQSQIGDAFKEVKQLLDAGRQVLFVGTPCQIAGLYGFLGASPLGLITADFICHGVPSPKVLKKYAVSMEAKFKQKFTSIDFRDKRRGWLNNVVVAKGADGGEVVLKGDNNSFYNSFIRGTILRKSCFECPVIGLPRFGQVTIGDFWGIERDDFITQESIGRGVSLLMFNDPNVTENLLTALADRMTMIPRTLAEAQEGNAPMCIPAEKPKNREDFFRDLDTLPYPVLARKYLQPSFKRRATQWVKENFSAESIAKVRAFKNILKW